MAREASRRTPSSLVLRRVQWRIVILGTALPALCACIAPAYKADTADAESAVLTVQARRFQAMTAADVAALNRILSDDLVYTHTTGLVDSKTSLAASIGSGKVNYVSLDPSDAMVRVYGETAVVTGQAAMRVIAGSQEHQLSIRFTEVYVQIDGDWKLVSWQSTRIP